VCGAAGGIFSFVVCCTVARRDDRMLAYHGRISVCQADAPSISNNSTSIRENAEVSGRCHGVCSLVLVMVVWERL
jgi:hypothetical protein